MTARAEPRFLSHRSDNLSAYADELGVHLNTLYRWLLLIKGVDTLGTGSGRSYTPTAVERRQLRALLLMDQGRGEGNSHLRGYRRVQLNVVDAIARYPSGRWVLANTQDAVCIDSVMEITWSRGLWGAAWVIDLDAEPTLT